MILTVPVKAVVDRFLKPINKLTDDCSITITRDSWSSLASDATGTILLLTSLKVKTQSPIPAEIPKLNVKNIKKVIQAFECCRSDDIELELDSNVSFLKHKSDNISFKLYLVTDSVIRKNTVSPDKLRSIKYDVTFELDPVTLSDVNRGTSILPDTNKIYIYKDPITSTIKFDITDRSQDQSDSIEFTIAPFDGVFKDSIPFNISVLRLLSSQKQSVVVGINTTLKVLSFTIDSPEVFSQYIIPAHSK